MSVIGVLLCNKTDVFDFVFDYSSNIHVFIRDLMKQRDRTNARLGKNNSADNWNRYRQLTNITNDTVIDSYTKRL